MGKTLRTRRQGGEPVTLLAAADERDEAEWVVRELERRAPPATGATASMAVLYRTNAQSRALEEAFRRAGVPYRLVGAISFYERREVKDLLAYLRLVANPADDEAFLRAIARSPPRPGRHQPRGARPHAPCNGASRCSRRRAIADGSPTCGPTCARRSAPSRRSSTGWPQRAGALAPAEVLEQVIRAIDYEALLQAEGPEGADRWENVRELVASAANWSEEVHRGGRGHAARAVPGGSRAALGGGQRGRAAKTASP